MEVEYFTLHPKTEKISDFQSLHTESEMFACVFYIPQPFRSKCMQRMQKHRKSNMKLIFFTRMKFSEAVCKRDTQGRIYFFTCENFGLFVQ